MQCISTFLNTKFLQKLFITSSKFSSLWKCRLQAYIIPTFLSSKSWTGNIIFELDFNWQFVCFNKIKIDKIERQDHFTTDRKWMYWQLMYTIGNGHVDMKAEWIKFNSQIYWRIRFKYESEYLQFVVCSTWLTSEWQ